MASKYSSGKHSIAECDRCGQRYKLSQLRKLTIKLKQVSIKVCSECWEMDQPQLHLGLFPINDPQAVREPRRDNSYYMSGNNGLDINVNGGSTESGYGTPAGGSRLVQWGWYPVGQKDDYGETPNYLVGVGQVGTVTIN